MPCPVLLAVTCAVADATVGAATSSVADSFLDTLRQSAADMVATALKTLGTFWLDIPSPQLGDGSGANAGIAQSLQNNLGFFAVLAAVAGLILCGARIGITAKGEAGADGVKMLVRLIGVTAAGGAIVALAITAGDAFAPWVIEQSTGSAFAQSAPSLLGNEALLQLTPLLAIVSAVFAVLGAAAMVIYMIIRGGLLIVLMAVWPLAASLSATEQGLQWYRKINAWMVAFVLLKPVAAIIYAAGFLLLRGAGTFTTGDPDTTALMSTLTGTAVLALAGLSLPALLRFVSPLTAAGSGAVSGAAIGVAAVAAGAAVVAGGAAIAGAGAASGGASGASSAGGGMRAGAGATGGGPPGGIPGGGGNLGGGGATGSPRSGSSGGGATDPGGGGGAEPAGGGGTTDASSTPGPPSSGGSVASGSSVGGSTASGSSTGQGASTPGSSTGGPPSPGPTSSASAGAGTASGGGGSRPATRTARNTASAARTLHDAATSSVEDTSTSTSTGPSGATTSGS